MVTVARRAVGGRPQSDVKDHVDQMTMQDGKIKQVCKHCDKAKLSAQFQSTNWGLHFAKECKDAPIEVRRAIVEKSTSQTIKDAKRQDDHLKMNKSDRKTSFRRHVLKAKICKQSMRIGNAGVSQKLTRWLLLVHNCSQLILWMVTHLPVLMC